MMYQDSGGFQFVSLSKFTIITEEGALFESPFTGEPTMLTVNILRSGVNILSSNLARGKCFHTTHHRS